MVRGGVKEEVRGQAEVLVKALHGLNDEGVDLVEGQSLSEERPPHEDGTTAAIEALSASKQ